MSVKHALRSRLIAMLLSERRERLSRWVQETRRRLSRRPHRLSVFLELDDPYSGLLAQYLPELAKSFDVAIDLHLCEAVKGRLRPAPELYAEYALEDARRLAQELALPFLDRGATPPVEHRRALLAALAAEADSEDFGEDLRRAVVAYWRGDEDSIAHRLQGGRSGDADALLAAHGARLKALGHYATASIHYGGEWYVGIDRLLHLAARLEALGARRAATPLLAALEQVTRFDLPVRPPAAAKNLPALELYFSFRSPYSWLAMKRVFALADAWGLRLELRPVLPMVSRGLPVPAAKLRYIAIDAAREARRLGIAFGRVADPLGDGVERCFAAFAYARRERRERDFVLAAGQAIWADGIDVASDRGLRQVTGAAGLFWPGVVEALADDGWRELAENNRAALTDAGGWGVPAMRLGDFLTWGQDRIWLVARELEQRCESEEGIVV